MLLSPRVRDLLRIGYMRVFRERRRYLGPASAVFFGTAGLILVMSMSDDVKREFNTRLDLIGGATVFQVYFEEKPPSVPFTTEQRFFYWDVISSVRALPGVAEVSVAAPRKTLVAVSAGDRRTDVPLVGVDGAFWELQDFKPVSGRVFTKSQAQRGERVCVIGGDIARRLFDGSDAAGRGLFIENDLYEIVGVVEGLRVGEGARMVFLPLSTALARIRDMTLPIRMFVRCKTWETVEETAAQVPGAIGEYLYTDRLRVDVDRPTLRRVRIVARWIEGFAYVAAYVALLLGGIGIWNVMATAVRSRTREIGLKKAVGAEDQDVLIQFLTEALSVCVGAALPGILAGWGALEAVSHLLQRHPPPEAVVANMVWSLLVALALGVAAGLYPSLVASRMEVTSALRSE
jgi:putative ABC transport system permease protein